MTPQERFSELAKLYAKGQFGEMVNKARQLVLEYPSSFEVWNVIAVGCAALGQISEAEKGFRKVIEINQKYAEGHYNLGIILQQQGKLDQAISVYKHVLTLQPDHAIAQNSIGNALKDQGKLDQAIAAYQRALVLKPDFAEASYNKGNALKDHGKLDEAIQAYQIALTLKPDFAEACYNLGFTLKQVGKLDQAIIAYKQALTLKPDHAEAYNNIGNALKDQGRFDEAISAYRDALAIKPSYAEAHNNIGNALKEQGKPDEAIAAYQRALAITPTYAEAYFNIGNVLKDQAMLDEAVAAYQRALALKPAYAEAYYNMGVAFQDQGKLDQTIEAFKRALEIRPIYAGVSNALGQVHLMRQNFTTGFQLCEWRWQTDQNIGEALVTSKPKWEGQEGKAVFLWSEQGIGDEIMFSSVIPDLATCCSKLIVRCDERLIPLFKRSFAPDVIFKAGSEFVPESEYDFHIPIVSAQGFFRTSLDSFKTSSMAYLTCETQRSDALRRSLRKDGINRIIGLSWSTNSAKRSAQYRNVSLEHLAGALFETGTALVNLQYGDVSRELARLQQNSGISISNIAEIDNRTDIDGLAALISVCDHVVSVDNSTVHLAGALGVDTRVLLPFNPDWRWGVGDSKSYWYNSLKLYRQKRAGEWVEVLDQVRKDLYSF